MEIIAVFKPGHIHQALIYRAKNGHVGWINVDPSNKFNQDMVDEMLANFNGSIIQNGVIEDVIQRFFTH